MSGANNRGIWNLYGIGPAVTGNEYFLASESSATGATMYNYTPAQLATYVISYPFGAGGPSWTSGSAVPSATQPKGSLYSRTGGAVGSTLYVSQGAGVWNAVAGV